MFWAVQGMAAELSTGILVLQHIDKYEKPISMLVTNMSAKFTKKATGKIIFVCNDGDLILKTIKKTIETKKSQTILVSSEGINELGITVSKFNFEWSLKIK